LDTRTGVKLSADINKRGVKGNNVVGFMDALGPKKGLDHRKPFAPKYFR